MTVRIAPLALVAAFAALIAGCGTTASPTPPADGIPRLDFGYDASVPLAVRDAGRINPRSAPIAVRDISFQSTGGRVQGYLLVPPEPAGDPR